MHRCSLDVLCVLFLLSCLLAIERVLTTADQSIAPSNEDIDVRLRYQGKDLVLSFPPTHGDAMYMASKFCHQKVSDQDLDVIRECTRKIGDYLIQEVEKHQQKQFMRQRVKTPFEESIAQNELEAESDVPTHTGFSTDEHKRVASRVSSSHLSDHYQLSDNGKLRVTLDIAGNRYIADYDMSRDSPIVAARRFCNVHKQELGITMQSLDTCVLPVEKHLRSIEREARLKAQSTISESNQEHHGVEDSTVEFDAFGRSHDRLNSRSNLDKFKSNKFQNLDEAMGASPKKSLKEDLNIQAALTKVTLYVGDESFDISFDPHREPLQRVAANFCVKNSKKWGLNAGNVDNECIKPVVDKLKEALPA